MKLLDEAYEVAGASNAEELREIVVALCDVVEEHVDPADSPDAEFLRGQAANLRSRVREAPVEELAAPLLAISRGLAQSIRAAVWETLARDFHNRYPAARLIHSLELELKGYTDPAPSKSEERPQSQRSYPLLNRRVGLPIGVPATTLTGDPKWIAHYASLGFNVITTRSLRTKQHGGFPEPNFVFVTKVPANALQEPPVTVEASSDTDYFAETAEDKAPSAANSYG
ncbi:MAG: hypothetical protein LC808_14890, partial [Actinobacteria bacterium]|nr:hypothetical protein [Actinomycetota bacterium]